MPETRPYMTFAQAARVSGRSEKTLRRWEHSGKLTIDRSLGYPRVPSEELLRLGVLSLTPDGQVQTRRSLSRGTGPDEEKEALRAERDRLQTEADHARADARMWQEEARAWQTQAQQLTETVNRLALNPPTPAPAPAPPDPAPAPASPPARRGFWRRLFGGE